MSTAPPSKPITIRTSGETVDVADWLEGEQTDQLSWLAGFLKERDEALGCPEADDDERATSANIILSCLRTIESPSLISRAEAAEEEVKRLREAAAPGVFIEPGYAEELARVLRMISDSLEGHRSRSTNFNGEIVRFSTVIERAAKQFDRHASPAKPSEQTNDKS